MKWVSMEYTLEPATVASTLLRQWERLGQGPQGCLEVPYGGKSSKALFRLQVESDGAVHLHTPFGDQRFTADELAEQPPDPLWDAVADICSHMESDHRETFTLFLDKPASEAAQISMPWVEQRGFFLAQSEQLHWVPFSQPCPTPDQVRASLIKMLRSLREQNRS